LHNHLQLFKFLKVEILLKVEAAWLKDVDKWLHSNLNEKLLGDGFNPNLVLDFTHIYLAAHSSGAHVTVNYLNTVKNSVNILLDLNIKDVLKLLG